MCFSTFRKLIVSTVVVFALFLAFAGVFLMPQQASKQENLRASKRKWSWLVQPPSILELIEIKNLDSDKWMEDLEIKVRNRSEEPIYYVDFRVSLPKEYMLGEAYVSIPLEFGNPKLWSNKDASPSPDDKFLGAGEEVFLKVDDKIKPGIRIVFERLAEQNQGVLPLIPRVDFYFHRTAFGDGTSYLGTKPVFGHQPKRSSNMERHDLEPPNGAPVSLKLMSLDLVPFLEFEAYVPVKKTAITGYCWTL